MESAAVQELPTVAVHDMQAHDLKTTQEKKLPPGRRPKAVLPPKRFERQDQLKMQIASLPDALKAAGFADVVEAVVPITLISKEVVDDKTKARIGHVQEPLAAYMQRTSVVGNLSQRAPFDHLIDPIYRRLMRDFIQGAQMPEARVAALRHGGKVTDLKEAEIKYSIIDGLQRSWCYSTVLLMAFYGDALVTNRSMTQEAWDYFRPFIEKLGDRDTAIRGLLKRVIRYEIYYNIGLEGLLHYMVTFNTAQRRMSLPVQLELMRMPLIDEIERATEISVFKDSVDIETHGRTQKKKEQFAASDLAVAAEAFITNNPQASQKDLAEDFLEKDVAYASGVDVGDIADVIGMLTKVAKTIHPEMLTVYQNDLGKKFYFSGGGTFMAGFAAACGYIRNRGDKKKLDAALDKLLALLKSHVEDPLSLDEYQKAILGIRASRGKMMRRLAFDTFLRFFNGTTDRLEWTDAVRSLTIS